jgi:hypothetical protein
MSKDLDLVYRPKIWLSLLILAWLAGNTFLLADIAIYNDRGLIINGVIHLNTLWATVFYWALTLLFASLTFFFVTPLIYGLSGKTRLKITTESISFPKDSWSKESVVIPLSDISSVGIQTIKGNPLLNIVGNKSLIIHHAGGTDLIRQSMLPHKIYFENVKETIALNISRNCSDVGIDKEPS